VSVNDICLPTSGKLMEFCQPFHQGCGPALMVYRHRFNLIRGKKEVKIAASAGDCDSVPQSGLSARKVDRGMHVPIQSPGVIKKLHDAHCYTSPSETFGRFQVREEIFCRFQEFIAKSMTSPLQKPGFSKSSPYAVGSY
jgi:hypothetical protein